jgi:CubicO group peptidase (beta-lactamase class C family)
MPRLPLCAHGWLRCGSLLSVAGALCLVSAGAFAQAALPDIPGLVAVDSMSAAEFARDGAASLTVGVVSAGELVWTRSFGYADVATRRLADRHTLYRVGSVTKTFTAVMLLQLMEAGKVRLTDPVARYLPEFARVEGASTDDPPLTFQHLATMTSGLPAEPRNEGSFWTGPVSRWDSTLVDALSHVRLTGPPGTGFGYSSLGFGALGVALQRAAGMSYLKWQRTRILDPLGMRHSGFELDPEMTAALATGYEVAEDGSLDATLPARELREGRGYRVPAGGLFTTVEDLARFVSFELGHGPESVLSHASLDRAFAGMAATDADLEMGYGLGFMVQERGGFTWLGHSGGIPGYMAMMYYDREHQLGVIVLRNATGGRARIGRLAPDLLRTLIDARLDAQRPAGGPR